MTEPVTSKDAGKETPSAPPPDFETPGSSAAITILDVEKLIEAEEAATPRGSPFKADKCLAAINEDLTKLFPQYVERVKTVANRRTLDWELCAHGVFSEADLLACYAKASGLPVIDEEEFQNIERMPEFSLEYLASCCCIPYKREGKTLRVAVSEPYGVENIAYMFRRIFGAETQFALAKHSHIDGLISSLYSPNEQQDELGLGYGEESEEALRNMASEARIVRLVNEMLSRAAELEASDIHVEPEEKELVIRYRIDGNLQVAMTPPLSLYPAIASRIKLVGGLNIAERRLPQDGRTNIQIGRSSLDIRISTVPSMNGESIVLRLLSKDSMVFDLKNVGMLDQMRGEFEKLIETPYGIILVVGPTGSGKSTTLYSVMAKINTPDRKIITIEDPVEYRTEGLTQSQVNPKIGLDFASGLRHIVRQDPDVILVGEIRDRETAEIAIHSALTGHLVFSTLHTNDAPGAVSRLLDMGVEGFLISSSLIGVLSQRLVRRICDKCGGSGKDSSTSTGKCKRCAGSGFKGRIGIFELMVINEEIRSQINKHADSSAIAKVATENGMRPIIDDGMKKAELGITTKEEVASVAININAP